MNQINERNLRYSVPEEIWPAGTKWAGLTRAQRAAVAQRTAERLRADCEAQIRDAYERLRADCEAQIRDAYEAFGVPQPGAVQAEDLGVTEI
jgi:hypothetical protein